VITAVTALHLVLPLQVVEEELAEMTPQDTYLVRVLLAVLVEALLWETLVQDRQVVQELLAKATMVAQGQSVPIVTVVAVVLVKLGVTL
jgi:hypothetical protein